MFKGRIRNRDLVQEALDELIQNEIDHNNFSWLLSEYHGVLRDVIQLSTTKTETMLDASLTASTLGCKINGSGGDGCMFAYCPGNTEDVALAIERSDGDAYIINQDTGVM